MNGGVAEGRERVSGKPIHSHVVSMEGEDQVEEETEAFWERKRTDVGSVRDGASRVTSRASSLPLETEEEGRPLRRAEGGRTQLRYRGEEEVGGD